MADFTDFFFGSNIAVWEEAIGEIFEQIEDQRQAALAAIYLSTAAISDLSDRYAVLTGGKIDPAWQLEVFREHLQETIQAFLMLGGTGEGISQVVAATTMIPPVIRDVRSLSRWLLGFQYLPNRFFKHGDGFVCATVDGPYTITQDTNTLIVTVDGGTPQTITLPSGDAVTEQEVIDAINSQLIGAVASLFGKRFCIETLRSDAGGSVRIEIASTADTLFGLDNFTRQNAPPPPGLQGSQPFDWRIEAPTGSLSLPKSIDAAIFGTGSAVVKATKDSPYPGLIGTKLLGNGSFNNGFTEWDTTDGPDFFITTSKSHSGHTSLAVRTRRTLVGTTLVDVVNTIKTEKKSIPSSGCVLQLTGFHQATNEGPVYISPPNPPTLFTWQTSNAVFGYVDKQVGEDPIISTPDQVTVTLTDLSVNFVDLGVKVGMVVHIDDGVHLFDGVIKGVFVSVLAIDLWRKGPNGTPKDVYVSGGASLVPVTYTSKGLIDPTQDFIAAGVQTAPSFNPGLFYVRDKIRVDTIINGVHRQIVRDILFIDHTVIGVGDWGGSPTPVNNSRYFVYRRPLNGAAYTIFHSLSEAPTTVGAAISPAVSAQFKYTFQYFDQNQTLLGSDDTGILLPAPSQDYSSFSLEATPPPTTKFAQLLITVSPDPAGPGALATIDDLVWECTNKTLLEFHVANDSRMQKVVFKNETQSASGIISYTGYPQDGDFVHIGNQVFEFDIGSRSSGVLTYSGQPADGDTFTLGGVVFEFDSDCVVAPGHIQSVIGATDDETFSILQSNVVAFLGSMVTAVLDTTAKTITFRAKIIGPIGDTISFQANSTAITLNPSGGFLFGGSLPAVQPGAIPIHIQDLDPNNPPPQDTIDQPYIQLTQEINIESSLVSATINTDTNQILIQAQEGLSGNQIIFLGNAASPPAFTLITGNPGFLSGGTALNAGGLITYSGQPADGDVLVIGSVGYEFDSNASGICGGTMLVPINPSGVGFTYSGLTALVNAVGEATTTLDVTSNTITVTANTPGVAGNTTPFRKESSVLTILPNNGDTSAQTATGTNNISRNYAAALVTYETAATPPTVAVAGTFQTISGIQTATVGITSTVFTGNKVIVCVGTASTTQDPTPPTCVDTQGGTYNLDASVTSGGNGRVYVFSRVLGSNLTAGTDTIIVSVNNGQQFNGVAISVLNASVCMADQTATNTGVGTSLTVGPTSTLSTSGELVLAVFSILGPSSDVFTPGTGYSVIGRVGTGADPNQVTVVPEVKVLASGHLDGAIAGGFVDPDNPTCDEVAAYLNARLSGITAFCEVVPDVFPHGRLGLKTLYSGVNSCLVIGFGSANPILGFADGEGVCNDISTRRPAWEVAAGGSGVVSLIARAVPQANKFFGTDWHLRFWTRAFHPSGIAVSGLTVSGILGYASLRFDSGILNTGTPLQITESPAVVEVIASDPGQKFQEIEARMTFSGVTSGIHVVASEPYLINETDKSLHLSSHTIPRNKQREYGLHRLTIANPDSFTVIEAGLVGIVEEVNDEPVVLIGTQFTDLQNKNIFENSESVSRRGIQAFGTITYTGNPADGDIIRLGDDVYEFDNNFVIGANNIQVVIGLTADDTFQNFVDQVLSNSLTHEAEINTELGIVTVRAITPGVAGNKLIFTANSSVVTLSPITSQLTGGVDPQPFTRNVDYIIRYDTGQLARTGTSTIPDPSPSDLVIDYSFFPGGVDRDSSYPQTIKPVGQKIEPDRSARFFFFGTSGDFANSSGISTNFVVVPRVPDRFSYLKPIERGRYAQVVVFSGVGFSAPLDFTAKTDQDSLLVKNGMPIPQSASGWQFQNENTIVLNPAEVDPTATYEFEYFLKYQYTTPPISVPEPETAYVLLPYSYKVRNVEEIKEDVQKVLTLDENRIAKLTVPAIMDQALATLEKTVAGQTQEVGDEFWQFVDETTVEVFLGAFDDSATYTLTYKSLRVEFVSPVNEQWEFATTDANMNFGPFVPFNIGDKFLLGDLVQFRVTAYGDFDVDDYRVRSVAGIVDSPFVSNCGFGFEPFGKLPFGGCGLQVFEEPTQQQKALTGTISLGGTLTTAVSTLGSAALFTPNTSGGFSLAGTSYWAIAQESLGGLSSTPGIATAIIPIDLTLTSLFIVLQGNLTAASLTAKFCVNGVARNEIVVTMTSGSRIGSATGSLPIHAGDTLCVQITVPSSTTTLSMISAGYKVNLSS